MPRLPSAYEAVARRHPPCLGRYTHPLSVNEAITQLEQHDCTYASLDHDLGDYAEDSGHGYKLVLWMAEHDRWPSEGIRAHSANPPGMARMLADIDHYGPYPPGNGVSRGVWPR
jgi:hypothetical protein